MLVFGSDPDLYV